MYSTCLDHLLGHYTNINYPICVKVDNASRVAKSQTFFAKNFASVNAALIRQPGNTKGGNITVLLTSCMTGLESAV